MATGTLDFTALSVNRTFAFPDVAGTIALTIGSTATVTVGVLTAGTWHATVIGAQYGGTGADLSATGGAHQVLKQVSTGAAVTVGQLTAADISTLTATQTAVPSDGATVSVTTTTAPIKSVFLRPAGDLAALTLAVADGSLDGQLLNVYFGAAVAVLTVTGNFDGVSNIPNAPTAGVAFTIVWDATGVVWALLHSTGN